MARLNPLLSRLDAYPLVELTEKRSQVEARNIPLYDFGLGDPVDPTPAFIQDALKAGVQAMSRYPVVQGTPEFRRAVTGYLERRFGVALDPDRSVVPTSGSKEAMFHLPLLVVDRDAPDRAVVFPDPGYPAWQRGALFAGGEAVPIPLEGDFRFRPWELPADLLARTRLLIVNSPHNPTGAVSTLEDLERTWKVCRAHDILLASDETYCDIYEGEPPPSILQVATEGVVAIHTLSKRSSMAGYRTGFFAGDPAWIRRLTDFRANPGVAAQDFVNAAASAAWADDAHPRALARTYMARRRMMEAFLEEAGFEFVRSNATFYIWFKAPAGYDDVGYAARLLEAGIVAAPGRLFALTDTGRDWLRLALMPDSEGCSRAIEAWRALL
ncbi:MAG: aminotransferase class I/II-fold pyridoxal phosphate-dependent enzyme [Deltaproteobacteria bacterium]|nr:aminotransferase class I/II-fold pyridoxal phosphate-dependent enzyme [Deltaproteobacteria bacterium]